MQSLMTGASCRLRSHLWNEPRPAAAQSGAALLDLLLAIGFAGLVVTLVFGQETQDVQIGGVAQKAAPAARSAEEHWATILPAPAKWSLAGDSLCPRDQRRDPPVHSRATKEPRTAPPSRARGLP